jgi:hypothetical protein
MSLWKRFTRGKRGHARHEIGAAGANGFGAPYHMAWEYRPLPGAGANQWAWETLALPMYTPIGAGTRNRRQQMTRGGVMVAVQGVVLTDLAGAPVGGTLTGQFTTQPLLDVTQAEAGGIQTPAYTAPANQFEFPSQAMGGA